MRRAIAIVLAGSFALPLQAQQSALQPQTIQMECRGFGPNGSNLAPDEILVNGKACREINANAKDQPPSSTVRPALQANIQAPLGPITELAKSSVDSVVLIDWTDENSGSVTFGSGFVVSPDGKIVTNHHVIAGAHSATVKMNNGAYTESGGSAGVDLTVHSQDLTTVHSFAGVGVSSEFPLFGGQLVPQLVAGWNQAIDSAGAKMSASFVSAPAASFTLVGRQSDPSGFLGSAAVDFGNDFTTISLGYDGIVGGKSTMQSAHLRISSRF